MPRFLNLILSTIRRKETKMIITDPGYALAGKFDPMLPLGLTLTTDGVRTVTTFDETRDAAEYLDSLPEDEIFTEKTKKHLIGLLGDRMSDFGYDTEVVFTTEYVLDNRLDVDRSVIRTDTEPLLPEHGYENLTECEPDPLGEGLLCFGTVIDGKIVSAAAENPHSPDDTVIDIGVETADGHTGNGYGASNIASLAYYLLDPEMKVTYIVEDDNIASVRIAEKVGFAPGTRELRVVCRKK